jgi:uncharacterized protein (TIGR03067 family)
MGTLFGRRMMTKRLIVFVATVVLVYSSTAIGGDGKKDQEKLQGSWVVESFLDSDPKGGIPKEILKDMVTAIKDDTLKVTLKDQPIITLKFKLDPSKAPKTVDFTHLDGPEKGKTELGIYKFDGEKLVMAVNDAGMARPEAFATKEGTKISVITLTKKK